MSTYHLYLRYKIIVIIHLKRFSYYSQFQKLYIIRHEALVTIGHFLNVTYTVTKTTSSIRLPSEMFRNNGRTMEQCIRRGTMRCDRDPNLTRGYCCDLPARPRRTVPSVSVKGRTILRGYQRSAPLHHR